MQSEVELVDFESNEEERVAFESDQDRLVRQVSSKLKASKEQKKNPLKQIGILAITIFPFINLGFFERSVSGIGGLNPFPFSAPFS